MIIVAEVRSAPAIAEPISCSSPAAAERDIWGSRAVIREMVMTPCGTTNSWYALLKAATPTPGRWSLVPASPALVASRVITENDIWVAATRASAQPAERSGLVRPEPRQSKRGLHRNFAARNEGTRARACTTMPRVLPRPSSRVDPEVICSAFEAPLPITM